MLPIFNYVGDYPNRPFGHLKAQLQDFTRMSLSEASLKFLDMWKKRDWAWLSTYRMQMSLVLNTKRDRSIRDLVEDIKEIFGISDDEMETTKKFIEIFESSSNADTRNKWATLTGHLRLLLNFMPSVYDGREIRNDNYMYIYIDAKNWLEQDDPIDERLNFLDQKKLIGLFTSM